MKETPMELPVMLIFRADAVLVVTGDRMLIPPRSCADAPVL